jgi:glutamine amidotransferase
MKIAVINYGMGNLGSVRRAFEDIGADVFVANHPSAIYDANRIVLPGVGAFTEGMKCLTNAGWASALQEVVIQQGKPLLGICLGMQMLATSGHEGGETQGLGFIPGKVQRLDAIGCKFRIPHVGWNDVSYHKDDVLFNGIPDLSDFYFVHSYAFVPEDQKHLIATTSYDCDVTATIRNGNVFGCQFHPEKSSKAGRQLLRNFMSYVPC